LFLLIILLILSRLGSSYQSLSIETAWLAVLYVFVSEQQQLPVGDLWPRTVAATAQARAAGALHTIAAGLHFVEQDGIRFGVHVPAGHGQIAHARKGDRSHADPFLPYDPLMFVADLSPTHICLLNKFNVFAHHLLIVTRAFEEQQAPLNAADFAALWQCLVQVDGLAFYNAGRAAGASQRHKHLQLAPFPLWPGEAGLPMEQALAVDMLDTQPSVRAWPYRHAAVRVAGDWMDDPQAAGDELARRYRALLAALAIDGEDGDGLLPPYNLLATRRWLLLTPRSQAEIDGIPVNALGFGGSLLARTPAQLEHLRTLGPLAVLHKVTGAAK
jgi:ATP adenylyltransferase